MIFFIHIPKTAGTTFYQVVKNNHSQFLKPKMVNDSEGCFDNMVIEKNTAIRLPGGYASAPEVLAELKKLTKGQLKNISFLGGHVGFGFHLFMNSIQGVDYVSFYRNPVERVLSDYREHCKVGRFFYEGLKQNDFDINWYLNALLRENMDNLMTRQLAGPYDFFLKERMEIDHETLKRAIANSKEINFFHMDEFKDSLKYFKNKCGWKKLNFGIQNVSEKSNKTLMFDEDLMKRVTVYDVLVSKELSFYRSKNDWISKLRDRLH